MNQNDHQNREDIRQRLAMGERLDSVLESALKRENAAQPESPREAVVSVGISVLLGLGALAAMVYVFLSDWSNVPGVMGRGTAELGLKAVASVGVLLVYVLLRRWILGLLFPSVHQEIIKTIYKVSPELSALRNTAEQNDIMLNKNSITHYTLILVFFLGLAVLLALSPQFISFAFGIILDGTVGAIIIQLILGLFSVGVYLSIRSLMKTHREYDYLQEMTWRVANLTEGLSDTQKLKSAQPSETTSLIAEKLRAIERIIRIKGHVSPEDLRDHSFSHSSISQLFPYFITSAMPIFGLIGTILGLTISIGGFEAVLKSSIGNQASFVDSIGVSVAGIGTAFYTTLAGTFGMIGLKFFNMITSNARRNFLVDMDNVVAVEVLPRLRSTTEWKHKTMDDAR